MATDKKTTELLQEDNSAKRDGKFLVMGSRREGGQLQPVMFRDTQVEADAAAGALTGTGWANVEVYTRVSSHARKV